MSENKSKNHTPSSRSTKSNLLRGGKELPKLGANTTEKVKYSITVNQFAKLVEASESVKNAIIRAQIVEREDSFFWYQTANSSIRKHILSDDPQAIYDGIKRLKNSKPLGVHNIRNKKLSIAMLEEYLKFVLPLEFRKTKKLLLTPEIKTLNHLGVDLRITPDVVFRTEYNGQKVVGAVKLYLGKTKPLKLVQMGVVSFLLHSYLTKHVIREGEIALPEFCLCIDVYTKRCVPANTGTDAPRVIINKTCKELVERWDHIALAQIQE